MTAAYEALRAFVIGEAPARILPRGFGVLLHEGLPAWLRQWESSAHPRAPNAGSPSENPPALIPLARRTDLVCVLVDMVLSNRGRT